MGSRDRPDSSQLNKVGRIFQQSSPGGIRARFECMDSDAQGHHDEFDHDEETRMDVVEGPLGLSGHAAATVSGGARTLLATVTSMETLPAIAM